MCFAATVLAFGAIAAAGCTHRTPTGQPSSVGKIDAIAAALPEDIRASGRLTVAVNVPNSPNEFYDPNGKLVGFDVDLLNAVASALGLTTDYHPTDFANVIPSVQRGTVNVGMSSLTDTKYREKTVDFVTYFSAGTLWAQRTGSGVDPSNACGKTVAVKATTVQEIAELPTRSQACTDAGRPAITILALDDQDQATAALLDGRADTMSADSPVTEYAIKQSGGKLEATGSVQDLAPYGWPVKKGSALGPALQQALAHLIESGQYAAIATNWGIQHGTIDTPVINGAKS
ncbi:transporter substrate-binding domain-containing protein [Mycobacterium sp. 20091114027_K0903767]|nr:transporter substrate-binding domain-containing protein [Mycobacterium sp. 20091114027_K0903767]